MQRAIILAAGAVTAGVVLVGRRRKQRSGTTDTSQQELRLGKQQRQLVHAFQGSPEQAATPTAQQATDASRDNLQPDRPNMSYAYSSLLLLLSLAVAAYTVMVLLLRGQPDLAAAAALTWLLAAPALLSIGKQHAEASSVEAAEAQSVDGDATMVIADLDPPTKVLAAFHGTWIKDAAASTSMDAAMRLIHLNALMRQAVKLIKGVQLSIDEDRFKFGVFSAISWFKLNEFYPWSGEVAQNRRRDMRRGRANGRAQISAKGTIQLQYSWDQPHAGYATDEFSIDEQDRLRLATMVHVDGQTASYVQVYRRKRSSGGGGAQHAR